MTKAFRTVHSSSEEETMGVARTLGRLLKAGDWVALVGDLGAGKTLFVKGIAEGLECRDNPRSPTFALVQTYPPKAGVHRPSLRHVDLYRLDSREITSLEWEELFEGDGVTVVEWADKARTLWPTAAVEIRLAHDGENRRTIEFFGGGRARELA